MTSARDLIEKLVQGTLIEGRVWLLSIELDSVAPHLSYSSGTREFAAALKPYLDGAKVRVSDSQLTGLGYDDISIEFGTPREAINVARRLNRVLPAASSQYRREFGVKHNASVTGPYDSETYDELDYDPVSTYYG